MRLVVSGGQSGVDRAALDAAIEIGTPCRGWCPVGGWAEDFPEPPGLLAIYPELRETPSADPAQRTEWNARDSDATLLLLPDGVRSRGTLLTESFAAGLGRPLLRLDPFDPEAPGAAIAFIEHRCPGGRLNIAGPRESEAPGVYRGARELLGEVLAPAHRA